MTKLALLLALTCPALCAGQVYSLQKLDRPRAGDLEASFVNDQGQVVIAWSFHRSWVQDRDGTVTEMMPPQGILDMYVRDFSQNGFAAIEGYDTLLFNNVPVLYMHNSGSRRVHLPAPARFGGAEGVNRFGQVVGWGAWDQNSNLAFLTHLDGTAEDLGTMPGYRAITPYDINDQEVVVGRSYRPDLGDRAVQWTRKTGWVDLGAPPGALGVFAYDVNEEGMVVGYCTKPDLVRRVFVKEPGKEPIIVDGPIPDGGFLDRGLNDHGDIAGRVMVAQFVGRAALWKVGWPNARWVSDMLDGSALGWDVRCAYGPNNKGQMGGIAFYNNATVGDAVLLAPHSYNLSPASLSLLTGKVERGSVTSLGEQDGDALAVRRFMLPNSLAPAVSFTVWAKTAMDTRYLWLKVRARATSPSAMKVRLWGVTEKAWETKYFHESQIGTDWRYGECVARRRLENYMESDGTVRAKVDVWPVAPGAFVAEFDQASFEYAPESG